MFRVVFRPLPGAHNTGIKETSTATCRERTGSSRQVAVTVSIMPDTVDTVI